MMIRYLVICVIILFMNFNLLAEDKFDNRPAIIFASSNLQSIFPEIIREYYFKYPNSRVLVQYGASGRLAQSIIDGVSCDIFYSADMKYPQKVSDYSKNYIKPQEYIRGNLILFSYFDLSELGLKILEDKRVANITLANKLSAPYGKAAINLLNNLKMFDRIEHKIRFTTDIYSAITNVVWSGDSAILSKSSLSKLPKGFNIEGKYWINIDKNLYSPIIQGFTLSKRSLNNSNVRNFQDFFLSKKVEEIFIKYGYSSIQR